MAEILPGVHLIDGIDPSPDFSTHVYLVKDKGASWTLIDTGLPGAHEKVEAYLSKIHVEPHAVKKILLTHLHRDHTGSLKHMAKVTGARTFAHWIEAAYIAEKPKYDGPGSPPAEPFRVDEVLKDGDTVDAAGGLIAYHTPGHTPGHTAYYQAERKVLFSGDLFFGGGDGVDLTPPEYSHHPPTAQISARRMSQLSVDSLMTYHGGPLLTGGGAAVRKLVERL
ncbi:MAG: MBL fold metallo-hydrolase [Thermoplasmata archaeon]|jgi:glyoxylase-like metal-dependent hydrolase (beta-lactamase superfamily II)